MSSQIEKTIKQHAKQVLTDQGINATTKRGNKELRHLLKRLAQTTVETPAQAVTVGIAVGEAIAERSKALGKTHLDGGVVRQIAFAKALSFAEVAPSASPAAAPESIQSSLSPATPSSETAEPRPTPELDTTEPDTAEEEAVIPAEAETETAVVEELSIPEADSADQLPTAGVALDAGVKTEDGAEAEEEDTANAETSSAMPDPVEEEGVATDDAVEIADPDATVESEDEIDAVEPTLEAASEYEEDAVEPTLEAASEYEEDATASEDDAESDEIEPDKIEVVTEPELADEPDETLEPTMVEPEQGDGNGHETAIAAVEEDVSETEDEVDAVAGKDKGGAVVDPGDDTINSPAIPAISEVTIDESTEALPSVSGVTDTDQPSVTAKGQIA